MAKKNLARTAIEGGRVPSIRVNERFHTRSERRASNAALQRIKSDPDLADRITVDPRTIEYREFDDKLNPVYRWLEKQAGKSWNEVYSKVKAKFPTRSLAGRHIMEHIERFVTKTWHDNELRGSKPDGLVIGEDGILRNLGHGRRYHRYYYRTTSEPDIDLENEVHWLLDNGLHKELNQYLKLKHGSFLPSAYFVRVTGGEQEPVPVRLLMGKHDVGPFVEEIKSGYRKADKNKNVRYHPEWKTNLLDFIKKVRSR